jgi:hypothetical protein
MKYRLPVKVIIVKRTVRGMIAREQIACMGNPQYGVQSQPIGFEAVAKACEMAGYAINNPKLVERVLREAFNHPGPSVVRVAVDLIRTIHDGYLEFVSPNELHPMTTRPVHELGGRCLLDSRARPRVIRLTAGSPR